MQQFGTGSTSIRVTQDLQVLAGLPPLVRDGDQFSADADPAQHDGARDEGARHAAGHGQLPAAGGGTELARVPIALPPQDVVVAAGAAKEVVWPVRRAGRGVQHHLGSGGRGRRRRARTGSR